MRTGKSGGTVFSGGLSDKQMNAEDAKGADKKVKNCGNGRSCVVTRNAYRNEGPARVPGKRWCSPAGRYVSLECINEEPPSPQRLDYSSDFRGNRENGLCSRWKSRPLGRRLGRHSVLGFSPGSTPPGLKPRSKEALIRWSRLAGPARSAPRPFMNYPSQRGRKNEPYQNRHGITHQAFSPRKSVVFLPGSGSYARYAGSSLMLNS